ncbi:hypothetical protein IJI55_00640 [Candidatus Saccharibacteria bacterium]|nr:hypothetical protein [Candidatus Saccharibacteria bacterium]
MFFKKKATKKPLPAHFKAIQAAAEICMDSEDDHYFQDEFIDIFRNGKSNASGTTFTYVQIKPIRGNTKRVTVYKRNDKTNEVFYLPQEDFWENHLLEVANKIKNRPTSQPKTEESDIYDIPKEDIRRERLDSKKLVAKKRREQQAEI